MNWMKIWLPALALLLLLAATLGAGSLHGRLTGRWGLNSNAALAAEQLLSGLPAEAGNWRLRHESELDPEVVKILQCPAHISRVYEHRQTRDVATVAVLLGPPGPIAVHTPEICYSSRDFQVTGERRKVTIRGAGGEHSFWELPLKTTNVHAESLSVLYGWSTGSLWEAARYPRFGYGGFSHLYKLQVAVTSNPAAKAAAFDAGRDFMDSFVVQLQSRLVQAKTPRAIDR
jgi:hypothetical protein